MTPGTCGRLPADRLGGAPNFPSSYSLLSPSSSPTRAHCSLAPPNRQSAAVALLESDHESVYSRPTPAPARLLEPTSLSLSPSPSYDPMPLSISFTLSPILGQVADTCARRSEAQAQSVHAPPSRSLCVTAYSFQSDTYAERDSAYIHLYNGGALYHAKPPQCSARRRTASARRVVGTKVD